jgi:non-ribosomal peptide synthase protein (TIGR01720 family)
MLRSAFGELFGIAADELDVHATFLELGADSLTLLRASQIIQEKFGVKIPFRLLLDEVASIEALSHYVAERMPADALPPEPLPREETPAAAPENVAAPARPSVNEVRERRYISEPPPFEFDDAPAPSAFDAEDDGAAAGSLERFLERQIQTMSEQMRQQTRIMSQQLELLRGAHASASSEVTATETRAAAPTARPASDGAEHSAAEATRAANGSNGRAAGRQIKPESFVPHQQIRKATPGGLSARQQNHLDRLIARVVERTKESKRQTQTYRRYLADSRSSAGFRHPWKEMCYPLVIESGKGSKVYDVDGNEYVDLTMGFGALLFGHSPQFMIDALQDAVGRGVRLGGQSHLVGETAELICELTGVERVAFCNSGTEAVMGALRLARTVTGRTKVALFDGSYHGTFDGVMVKPAEKNGDGSFKAVPLAPGIPHHMIENVLLLGYDDEEALAVLRRHAHELAAVLIEPPRSRRPDVQPREFLQELRKITEETGAALIFDEVVTGFRFHPGGVQAMFGVNADLVCYGKAIGGGVPVAAVAGHRKFMDAVDGGMWQYGDASYPREETTFFAGTYFKNPLIVAAVRAVLGHIKSSGARLYEELNGRALRLASTLNEYFEREQVPMAVAHLGSLLRFVYPGELKLMELFYYHLLEKGVYICETRNCFLSTAHTDEDVAHIVRAVREAVEEMRAGGIIPDKTPDGPDGDKPSNYQLKDPFGGLRYSFAKAEPSPRQPGASACSGGASARSADLAEAGVAWSPQERAESAAGELPLTPVQRWFFEQELPDPHHFNQAVLLEVPHDVDASAVEKAIHELLLRHDALRLRFGRGADGWTQRVTAPGGELPFAVHDFSNLPESEQRAAIERVADEAQRSLNLGEGALVRAALMRFGGQRPGRLLIVIHHLAVDISSWRILLEDFQAAYGQASRGAAIRLPPGTSTFAEWARRLDEYARGPELAGEMEYWLNPAQPAAAPLPADYDGENTEESAETFSTLLDPEATRLLLQEAPKVFHALPSEMLLAALLRAQAGLGGGGDGLTVDLEGHGREAVFGDLDVSRTIGWFTSIYPLRLSAGGALGAFETLECVREQARAVPRGGVGYGLLKYSRRDGHTAARLRALPRAQVCFNYVGPSASARPEGALVSPAAESYGAVTPGSGLRPYLLMITAQVEGGRLRMNWSYSRNVHRAKTIRLLAERFDAALGEHLAHCRPAEVGYTTPDLSVGPRPDGAVRHAVPRR